MELYVPDADAIRRYYADNKSGAYWAQIWPAAIGLCRFLNRYPEYILDKKVLELAAGVGLPGLFAARQAKKITITDKEPLAEAFIAASAAHLQLPNVTAATLDWTEAPKAELPDVILLSDVNYESSVFEELQKVIEYFLAHHTTVIVSTPQRLVAKPFVISLLPYCIFQWNDTVLLHSTETGVSIFVLQEP
ncbi:class I SAM-dependent methyltransferase [Niabella aquatica]